jgi:hypothetical protein
MQPRRSFQTNFLGALKAGRLWVNASFEFAAVAAICGPSQTITSKFPVDLLVLLCLADEQKLKAKIRKIEARPSKFPIGL